MITNYIKDLDTVYLFGSQVQILVNNALERFSANREGRAERKEPPRKAAFERSASGGNTNYLAETPHY